MTTATVNHMNMHTPSREEHYASNTKEKLTILPKGVKNIIFGMFHPEYISTMKKVQKNGRKLKKAPVELRDDIEIVMTAVKQNGSSLKYASKRLRNNKKVVLASIEGSESKYMTECYNFKYASKRLRNDKKFVRKVLKKNIYQIEYLPRDSIILDDEKTIRKILKYKHPYSYHRFFKFLSNRLQEDKDLFIEALNNSKASFSGLELLKCTKNDEKSHSIIKEFINNPEQFDEFLLYRRSVPDFFLDDIDFVKALVKNDELHLKYVSLRLRNNIEVLRLSLYNSRNLDNLTFASQEIKKEILKKMYFLTDNESEYFHNKFYNNINIRTKRHFLKDW